MTHRVLFVHGSGELAGMERVFATLLAQLDRSAVEPAVAALCDGPFVDALETSGIDVHRLAPVPRLREIHSLRPTVAAIRGAALTTGAELLVGNGEKMSVLAALAARPLGLPVSA